MGREPEAPPQSATTAATAAIVSKTCAGLLRPGDSRDCCVSLPFVRGCGSEVLGWFRLCEGGFVFVSTVSKARKMTKAWSAQDGWLFHAISNFRLGHSQDGKNLSKLAVDTRHKQSNWRAQEM